MGNSTSPFCRWARQVGNGSVFSFSIMIQESIRMPCTYVHSLSSGECWRSFSCEDSLPPCKAILGWHQHNAMNGIAATLGSCELRAAEADMTEVLRKDHRNRDARSDDRICQKTKLSIHACKYYVCI